MSTVLLAAVSVVFSIASRGMSTRPVRDLIIRPVRDLSGDCQVNWADVLILAEQWLMLGGVFQESDGLVVIEAEHYFSKTEGSGPAEGYAWHHFSAGRAIGEDYMQLLPAAGGCMDSNNIGDFCPKLSYAIKFSGRMPRTYYLWLKGAAKDNSSNDLHYGLDGSPISSGSSNCISLPSSSVFAWQSVCTDGTRPTVTVYMAGEHTLDLWMREGGVQIDRLLLTADPGYMPAEPPESQDFPELSGDLDGDYRVAEPDLALLAQHWSQVGHADPRLIANWRFDEGHGDVALDSSGNGNDGLIIGGAEWSAGGRLGGALNLQGMGSVKIPIELFSSVDNEITVALWQYGSESQPVEDAVFQTSRPGYATNLSIQLPGGEGEVIWDCPSVDRIEYPAANPAEYKGFWNHWTFTKNTKTGYARIYLNGSEVSSAAGKTEPIIPALGITQACLGSHCSGDGRFYGSYEGLVDDVRIYNRELDAAAVARLAAAGSACNPSPADDAYYHAGMVLTWSPGDAADVISHDVYFGASFDDVNNANNSLPVGGVYKGRQALDANSYDPSGRRSRRLQPGETYYWRIDEVTCNKRKAPRKGKVWKFEVSPIPKNIYAFNMNSKSFSESERLLMTSIMGVVAKGSPEVYLVTNPSDLNHNPKFWLDELQRKFPDVETIWKNDPAWYLNQYKDRFIKGYILYDSASLNAATSLAGIYSAVIVDASTESYAAAGRLIKIRDVRGRTDDWVYANYASKLNKACLFNHNVHRTHHLRDYAIYKNAFMCWEASEAYWANQNDHTQVFGQWVDEMQFFARCSRHNLLGVAADWLQCGSATSQWKVPIVKQRTHISRHIRTIPGRHYVAFVMSDGDNIQ
ncbi:MAG: hypothetical protein JSW47_15480, partial [Phycisphaerales bacterium]